MQRMILPNHILLPEVEKLVGEGVCVTMPVKGNSMLPFIRGGRDCVELRQVQSLRPRSIVLARLASDNYVIHRIVRLSGDEVVLMGDGNLWGTERCRPTDIMAEVIRIVRNGQPVSCSGKAEKAKVRIWLALLPVRRCLLAIYKRWNGLRTNKIR